MILLDTHIWLNWVIRGESSIPQRIAQSIENEDRVAISAISCFEAALLAKRGRIELPLAPEKWIENALGPSGIECLPVTCGIAEKSTALSDIHRDPADRIIIATALAFNASLASLDSTFAKYEEIADNLITG
jgi:PIN domain nuclease of toxin-antitoxin system